VEVRNSGPLLGRRGVDTVTPMTSRIVLARGDGIGPEIVGAVLKILEAAKVPLEYDEVEVGEAVYKRGITSGIAPESWDLLRKNKVILKGPISTPQGGGYKSLNVTLRKGLSLFANIRQCKAYSPFVTSHFPGLDMVIVRENEEGLYAGIEYRQTAEVYQALKLVTRAGCESIVRYAFEYARAYGRKKVTCMSKDNILKHTDGLFHSVFDEVAKEYADIENDHQIIDIGAARVAAQPRWLDVVVTLNLGPSVRHVRSHSRLGPGHRRQGHRQSFGAAQCGHDDAGASGSLEARRAHQQRLAQDPGGWHSHRRDLPRRNLQGARGN
jgi:isocitrate dehydrogenase